MLSRIPQTNRFSSSILFCVQGPTQSAWLGMCLSEESSLAKSGHCLLSWFCLSRSRCLSVFCRGPFLCSGAHTISLVGEVFLLVCFFCFLCGVFFAPNSFCWIFSGPVNVKYILLQEPTQSAWLGKLLFLFFSLLFTHLVGRHFFNLSPSLFFNSSSLSGNSLQRPSTSYSAFTCRQASCKRHL